MRYVSQERRKTCVISLSLLPNDGRIKAQKFWTCYKTGIAVNPPLYFDTSFQFELLSNHTSRVKT